MNRIEFIARDDDERAPRGRTFPPGKAREPTTDIDIDQSSDIDLHILATRSNFSQRPPNHPVRGLGVSALYRRRPFGRIVAIYDSRETWPDAVNFRVIGSRRLRFREIVGRRWTRGRIGRASKILISQ